jgi:hypothetical protein
VHRATSVKSFNVHHALRSEGLCASDSQLAGVTLNVFQETGRVSGFKCWSDVVMF